MKDPRQALQTALYSLLNPILSAENCLCRDHEPLNNVSDIVIIGEDFSTNDYSKAVDDFEVLIALHVYTKNDGDKGRARNREIQALLIEALAESDLDLGADFKLIDCRFDSSTSIDRTEDLTAWHGVVQFRLFIQHI